MAEKLGVKLAGVTITKLSGHNARFIRDSGIGPGAIIRIIRSGEVIPKVVEVIKRAKKSSTPSDAGFDWQWNENGVEAVQATKGTNATSEIRAIAHFFAQGLQVDGMGEGVVRQLYEAGYNSIRKIIRAKSADLAQLDGWQQRKANKVVDGIKAACKGADQIKVMAATGILGPLLGERKLRALQQARPKLFDLESSHTPKQLAIDLKDIPGFSFKSAAPVIANLSKCLDFIASLPITFKKEEKVKVVGSAMRDQVVVFTGVRSADAEKAIVQQGGSVGSGVNSKTTILVAKDPAASSSKLDKARSLGIKIVSLLQLNKQLGL